MAHKRSIRLQCMMSDRFASVVPTELSCSNRLSRRHAPRATHQSKIFGRGFPIVSPRARIPGRLTSCRLVSSPRTVSPIHIDQQCDPFATYRPVSCLSASMICRCIAIPQHRRRDAAACRGPWRRQISGRQGRTRSGCSAQRPDCLARTPIAPTRTAWRRADRRPTAARRSGLTKRPVRRARNAAGAVCRHHFEPGALSSRLTGRGTALRCRSA